MPWPPHLTKTRRLLVEAMRLIGLHGRMRCVEQPDGSSRITIVIDVPRPDDGSSDRARKREAERR